MVAGDEAPVPPRHGGRRRPVTPAVAGLVLRRRRRATDHDDPESLARPGRRDSHDDLNSPGLQVSRARVSDRRRVRVRRRVTGAGLRSTVTLCRFSRCRRVLPARVRVSLRLAGSVGSEPEPQAPTESESVALGPSKPAATGSGPGGPPCAAGPGHALANGGSSTAMALRPTQVPSHPAPARAAGCGNLNLLRRTLRRRDGRPAGPAAAASSQAAAPSPSLSRAPPSCQAVARTRTTRLLRVGCQCQWSPGRSGPGTSTGTVTSAAAAAPTPTGPGPGPARS